MRQLTRAPSGLAAALAVGLAATACGGSDGAPTGDATASPAAATTEAFCAAWEDALTALATLGGGEPSEEAWEEVRTALEDLAAAGTPDDLSADAQAGLAVFTDSLLAVHHDDLAHLRDADNLPGVTDAQEAQSRAFTEEAAQVCGKLG